MKGESIKERLTPIIKEQLDNKSQSVENAIFVFVSVLEYVEIDIFDKYIVDKDSFLKNGNHNIFSPSWFTRVFSKLTEVVANPDVPYSILSFSQFSYLIKYIQPDFFMSRLILVHDGFRSLLPLSRNDYMENISQENIEERSEEMPIYMAEQIQIRDKFYYSAKTPFENYTTLNVFSQRKSLQLLSKDNSRKVIDTASDPYGIDIFINDCINENDFNKSAIVKMFKKKPMNNQDMEKLEIINWLLGLFGGQLFELDESAIDETFCPSEEVSQLLNKYWGDNASFRNLCVYKNPDYGKDLINISQALIVETIINEYKNAKHSRDVRDLFLTAPTGAGKSLLFQLPAFYISSQKDVTIVVSPLIALMKDQVEQIRQERGFEKVYFINSELSLIDRERVIEDCKNGKIDILYLSPELLLSYDISYFIGEKRNLGLLVIDEAHLITTWGRDFRVDYWFLGQYINKIRKNHNYQFPMVAVTATAIYGGDNDMVFDSINSLYMHDPYLFIGEVKRKNITFVIDNHDKFTRNYNKEKEKETAKFIETIADEGIKTIVYAPYRRHIDDLMCKLEEDGKHGIAVAYHSGLSADNKNLAYSCFKDNEAKVMISTKAFGMGVDIPDIQLVYHHAPSGLLPDYVQEIGRAARKQSINGFAALSYAVEDQRYSKQLYGMSALTHYQIREMLNKINKTYNANGKKRNMLFSADDFSYIFDNVTDNDDLSQKVMTSLMMIEKDYLAKNRFNVLIARPKKLFVKVYCRVNQYGLNVLQQKYCGCYTILRKFSGDLIVVELDLDEIWRKYFSKETFPVIKRKFYEGKLLADDSVEFKPLIKITFTLESDFDKANRELENVLNAIQDSLAKFGRGHRYFSKDDLDRDLRERIPDNALRNNIVKLVLVSYSGGGAKQIDNDAFLQHRHNNNQEEEYRVFNNMYSNNFAKLKRQMQKLFGSNIGTTAVEYALSASESLRNYLRLGSLMEILGIGTYESKGGDNPMIFVRINDPRRIAHDAVDRRYKNSLLSAIERRHSCSSELFDYFFLHSFENEERWNFIEDFFLGESNEELFAKYPGGKRNHVDIVSYIRNHRGEVNDEGKSSKEGNGLTTFLPVEGRAYDSKDLLTIDNRTMRIGKWLVEDPLELDKTLKKYNLIIKDKETYKILMSKLRANYFQYYRDSMGLKLWIEFPDYDKQVPAEIPYQTDPVKFYKWWKKNEDKVTLSKKELMELLLKVNGINEKALIKKHKEMLKKVL